MDDFKDYLSKISDEDQRARTTKVLNWVHSEFPQLKTRIAWNQPMFTDHDTFIIGFSTSKKHLAVAPEEITITKFSDQIKEAGYAHTKGLIQIPWEKDVDFELLKDIIQFNIDEKIDATSFWRK
ncbi:iron chaperone [Pediococcus argentinicus]|uniref:YdhG-like domain-containing protein n=1 Tax=Pediococcus argentinicus TaxID=480391 RepID=A0A0R2NH56_9LACO|nr:iron chaperone [Pediococcus argentinicus]KRO25124.1 hypothetical protein IV88_GL000457 [Pediococcus argentinicus]NKZ22532.1 iron chaperone [Pediococcus argentinicus]GEP19630.1 intracellular iron chaperone frataxin [Pediococcus argentinicus]